MSEDPTEAWFETVSRETVHRGYSTVHQDRVRMPDGSVHDREVVEHFDAVAVVPLLDDGSVLLLKQYRHPLERYVLEIPAGKLDQEDEDRAEAARRELREEVGYDARDLDELVTFANSAGWNNEQTTVYLARGLHEAEARDEFELEAEEADMEIVRIPFDDAVAEARRGGLIDAKTVIGLLLAAERHRSGTE
ncbi:MAG: NUDIX hydrolase [Nitriliruptorales bacterium]|nr:NUDIX hydrolase [Nitriliruptorales bacterium]